MARLFLQRAMATFFAIRDGLKDARECKPPYFWALFTDKGEREAMAQNGWKSGGKVFVLHHQNDLRHRNRMAVEISKCSLASCTRYRSPQELSSVGEGTCLESLFSSCVMVIAATCCHCLRTYYSPRP